MTNEERNPRPMPWQRIESFFATIEIRRAMWLGFAWAFALISTWLGLWLSGALGGEETSWGELFFTAAGVGVAAVALAIAYQAYKASTVSPDFQIIVTGHDPGAELIVPAGDPKEMKLSRGGMIDLAIRNVGTAIADQVRIAVEIFVVEPPTASGQLVIDLSDPSTAVHFTGTGPWSAPYLPSGGAALRLHDDEFIAPNWEPPEPLARIQFNNITPERRYVVTARVSADRLDAPQKFELRIGALT